jgi:hypothetical protein
MIPHVFVIFEAPPLAQSPRVFPPTHFPYGTTVGFQGRESAKGGVCGLKVRRGKLCVSLSRCLTVQYIGGSSKVAIHYYSLLCLPKTSFLLSPPIELITLAHLTSPCTLRTSPCARKPLSVDHSFAQSPSHPVTQSLGHSPTHVLIPSSLMPFRPACRHTPVQPAFRISQVVFVDAHAHHNNHRPSTPSRNQGYASIKNKEPISYKVPFTPRYIVCLALIRRHHHHYLPLLLFYPTLPYPTLTVETYITSQPTFPSSPH